MAAYIEFYLRGEKTEIQTGIGPIQAMVGEENDWLDKPEYTDLPDGEQEVHAAANANDGLAVLTKTMQEHPMLRLRGLACVWRHDYTQFYSKMGSGEVIQVSKAYYSDDAPPVEEYTWWDQPLYVYSQLPDGSVQLDRYNGWEPQVMLPDTVEGKTLSSIKGGAFSRNTHIRFLTIPDSVTKIGKSFGGCSNLTILGSPNSIAQKAAQAAGISFASGNISEEMQDLRTNFDFKKDGQGLILTKYKGSDSSVVIPAAVDGVPVESIGKNSFDGCTGLKSITIPESVRSIGEYAFAGCTGLTSINIPDSVTEIGENTFSNTPWLRAKTGLVIINKLLYDYRSDQKTTDVVIPEGVTEIGDTAFADCSGLRSINIPDGVRSIGESAFWGCTGLTSITIPNSVTEIGYRAFAGCSGLRSINIPDGVRSIGESAFLGCTGLTSITIPNSVTEIGYRAFAGCSGLRSINIPDGVTEIGDTAFGDCTGLTSITIPNSVTEIGYRAFAGCTGLRSITISESVQSIGIHAFYGCTSLQTFARPQGLRGLNINEVFGEDGIPDSLTGVFPGLVLDECSPVNKQKLTILYLSAPEACDQTERKMYDSYLRKQKSKLIPLIIARDEAVVMANALPLVKPKQTDIDAYIETASKAGKTELVAVLLDYKNKTFSVADKEKELTRKLNSKSIANPYAVGEMKKLWKYQQRADGTISLMKYKGKETTVEIPPIIGKNLVTAIGNNVFEGCTEVRSIIIPEGVTEIGESTFLGCTGLTSITIPEGVTKIRGYTFKGCTELESITIPNGVTEIGSFAFEGCKKLRSITIPESVTKIINSPFDDTPWLKTKTGLVVINKLLYEYRSDGKTTELIIPIGVTEIAEYAFSHCTGLKSITIPEGVTIISGSAFQGCSGLRSINIPNGVTEIRSGAFEDCTGLTSITIPESVVKIGYGAFEGCTGLTRITIPDGVNEIGGWAFEGCKSLTIHTPAGSYAERYAKNNNILFTTEEAR